MVLSFFRKKFIVLGFSAIITLLIGFFSFVSFISAQHHKVIESYINKEAFLCDNLYKSTIFFPEKTKLQMQEKIMDYIKSVIEEEWSNLCKKGIPDTQQKLNQVCQL